MQNNARKVVSLSTLIRGGALYSLASFILVIIPRYIALTRGGDVTRSLIEDISNLFVFGLLLAIAVTSPYYLIRKYTITQQVKPVVLLITITGAASAIYYLWIYGLVGADHAAVKDFLRSTEPFLWIIWLVSIAITVYWYMYDRSKNKSRT